MSIVVMQEDENMFVLNLPIVEYLFRSISMWGNIKGASNLEVEVDENEEALNLQFH